MTHTTDGPGVYTAVDVHHAESIEVDYKTISTGTGQQWTDLVIGTLRVTIHGDHAKTAAMLMAAAGQCPTVEPRVCLQPTRSGPCTLAAGHHMVAHFHVDTVTLTDAERTKAEVLRDERDRALDQLDQAGVAL